jgi:hypothetical protein
MVTHRRRRCINQSRQEAATAVSFRQPTMHYFRANSYAAATYAATSTSESVTLRAKPIFGVTVLNQE